MSFNKISCDDTGKSIAKGTLLIANNEGSDFHLTTGRIYVATTDQGVGTFTDCVHVVDDRGIQQDYCSGYFCFYEGELVSN